MTTLDLTGDWDGHYVQSNGRHGISMRVVQSGTTFTGTMRDLDTTPTSLESLDDYDPAPFLGAVQAVTHHLLPEDSSISGAVHGTRVTFVKQYQGRTQASTFVHGHAIQHVEAPGHNVLYHGTLDTTGRTISGEWAIPHPGSGATLHDTFELRRRDPRSTP